MSGSFQKQIATESLRTIIRRNILQALIIFVVLIVLGIFSSGFDWQRLMLYVLFYPLIVALLTAGDLLWRYFYRSKLR